MFYILESIDGVCGGMLPLVIIIARVVRILHILIPIALIAFGTFDLGKAVISSDDKKIKEAQGHLIKRVVYAILVFLVPYIVSLIISLVSSTQESTGDETNYSECWKQAWER